ncbi:AraC family transcriptional regulator [Novisyntrophococcus fermenticellae]|uniref:AraC family transcriptional regulator n=1 Tax=Novisyntrophococcus fermenticellae TaxID=2068655 RepID=UPI001E3195E6|nr:AraC family transcriptional regulator [Novisyntrophococcus fermenticellae]
MIEILNGLHETINFEDSLGLRLYHNVDYEDYPEHWHTGVEIIMPLSSEYWVLVGENSCHLETGDIALINSGILHALKAPPTGERIILQFDAALLYTLKEMETLLSLLPPLLLLRKTDKTELYEFVHDRMNRIIHEYDERKTFREASIYAMMIEIFVKLGREATAQEMIKGDEGVKGQVVKQKEYLEVIMNACNYINRHYQENLTLEETANISGFSKFHFTRIFKQFMNMTFYEYLNSKRVKRAEELLYSTELSITDVAMNSGFSSLSAFNRTFKSVNGCSPSGFRNKVLQHVPPPKGGGSKGLTH